MNLRYPMHSRNAFFIPFLLLALSAAGAQLAIDAANVSPGGAGIVNVSLATLGDHVSGLQFDMGYDGSVLSINAVSGSSTRSAKKNVYYADLSSTSHRVILTGLNETLFGDGPVFTLFVNVGAGVPAGTYPVTFTNVLGTDSTGVPISLPDTSGVVTVAGKVGDVSAILSNGILNAGSLLPGAVSPGELIALLGSSIGPVTPAFLQVVNGNSVSTTLGSTQVKFDGTPAPLIYAGLNQVNAIVPYEIAGNATTQLTIVQNGQATNPITMSITGASPSIFTQNASGTGAAAALNENLTLNTPQNPAPAGTVIVLYLTGTGQADPAQVTGRINGPSDIGNNLLKVTATVAGSSADVLYSGPAPSLVAGATQVNLRVPATVTPSPVVPISIQVGVVSTQDDVVISVGAAK